MVAVFVFFIPETVTMPVAINDLSSVIQLTQICIMFSIISVYALPFRVAPMPVAGYELNGGLRTCLWCDSLYIRIIWLLDYLIICEIYVNLIWYLHVFMSNKFVWVWYHIIWIMPDIRHLWQIANELYLLMQATSFHLSRPTLSYMARRTGTSTRCYDVCASEMPSTFRSDLKL